MAQCGYTLSATNGLSTTEQSPTSKLPVLKIMQIPQQQLTTPSAQNIPKLLNGTLKSDELRVLNESLNITAIAGLNKPPILFSVFLTPLNRFELILIYSTVLIMMVFIIILIILVQLTHLIK